MYDITASIVIYNPNINHLHKTINSFLKCKLYTRLIIIDHSPIQNVELLKSFENIDYIFNPSNPGFGAGHNNAIKKFNYNSSYHLILNPDIYFSEGTLENIYIYMNENLNIGQLMPKVLYPDNSFQFLCKQNPTLFDLFARGFLPNKIKKLFKKRLDRFEYRSSDLNEIIFDIPYLSGCFMFFRTSTLKKVGFFDENIFMYLEDADISRRFLQHSHTVYYPTVFVYHYYSGLTHKEWKYKWITIKSAITYFNKWGWLNSII
jgi:GT2 family glycosyltransferase